MIDRPVYAASANGANDGGVDIYPVVYQTSGVAGSRLAAANGFAVPCVVCQAPAANEFVFTNVGRSDCPAGFAQEFNGYLMSAPYNGYSTDYTCVDQTGQTLGAANAQSGTNIYHVEPQGGSFISPGASFLWSVYLLTWRAYPLPGRLHRVLRDYVRCVLDVELGGWRRGNHPPPVHGVRAW